jgi:type I pantothenate kinase
VAIDVPTLASRLAARRTEGDTFVVGITGAVAAGKSTLARQLKDLLGSHGAVEVVATDGFLFDNASLEARGLLNRKGFPETYDMATLRAALAAVRLGGADFPAYSHVTYDIDPKLARRLDRPDVLIVEGLGLHAGAANVGLDLLIYLDADEAHLEGWFVERFLGFWRAAESDPASFYARFRHMSEAEVRAFAAGVVWRQINLPNLREHIVRGRDVADIVVVKDADHAILSITPP